MTTTLDLHGTAPPQSPKHVRWPVLGVRVPAHLAAWVRGEADLERTTVSAYLARLIRAARDGDRQPADVREWLTRQAAQCGCPGDPDQALTLVVRHLADRWPDGARLEPLVDR